MPKKSWKCCDCGAVTTNPAHQLIEYGFHANCPAKNGTANTK